MESGLSPPGACTSVSWKWGAGKPLFLAPGVEGIETMQTELIGLSKWGCWKAHDYLLSG